jgi:hypothetical protein
LGTKGVKVEDTVETGDRIRERGIQRDQIQDTAIDVNQGVKLLYKDTVDPEDQIQKAGVKL